MVLDAARWRAHHLLVDRLHAETATQREIFGAVQDWWEKSDVSVSHLCAGGPSMMMLIHRICMALSGFGSCIMVDSAISVNAAMLLKQEWHVQASYQLNSVVCAQLTCSVESERSF